MNCMKTKSFFLVMMTAVILSACSGDELSGDKQVGHSNLVLKIKGEKTAPTSRAGTSTPSGESTINNLIVFVFKANGDSDIAKPKEYNSSTTTVNLQVSTDATEVYVVANTAGNTDVQNALKAVTKKSVLQAIVGRGFLGDGTHTQNSTNLWMSGSSAIQPQANANATATVTLKYIPAKVRISSVTVDKSVPIELLEVLVYNAGGATKLVPADGATSLIPTFQASLQTPFYMGGTAMDANWVNKPQYYGTNTAYQFTLTGTKSIGTGSNEHDFYVFENDGATGTFESQPTILTLKAKNTNDNSIVYYSILFKANTGNDGYDDEIIERGKDYNVSMIIKKLGVEDPTIPTPQTTVEITIAPAEWQTVIMEKTYQ